MSADGMGRWATVVAVVGLMVRDLPGQWSHPVATVTFRSGVEVRADIADTPETRERGLMFRQSLGPNEGMLFVFERTGFYPFWMKNTLIPLDIMWIDEQWRIVSIAQSAAPCRSDPCPTYPPAAEARYVLEVAGGFSRTHGVARGDRVRVTDLPRARGSRP
jgi:uncharacterized membrane protein (UPF0127 family)